MNALTLKSPAKLNLFLSVLRKRPDGFHDIETVFERISLFDRVTLRPLPKGICLTSNSRQIPLGPTNLAWQAADLILRKGRPSKGIHIHLEKRIPVGAGLGGGSSNAAAVLLGVNRILKLGLSKKALLALGRRLGADVPFFLLECPFAIGRKKGDILTPIRAQAKITHLLVNNRVKVSTRRVYQQAKFPLTKPPQGAKIFQHLLRQGNLTRLAETCYNTLEQPALEGYPKIRRVKETLNALGLRGVTLSGSGATFFAFAESPRRAGALREAILSKHRWDVFICKTY